MAQVTLSIAGIEVGIEDEDSGFKPLARKARSLIFELIDIAASLGQEDEDDDEETDEEAEE